MDLPPPRWGRTGHKLSQNSAAWISNSALCKFNNDSQQWGWWFPHHCYFQVFGAHQDAWQQGYGLHIQTYFWRLLLFLSGYDGCEDTAGPCSSKEKEEERVSKKTRQEEENGIPEPEENRLFSRCPSACATLFLGFPESGSPLSCDPRSRGPPERHTGHQQIRELCVLVWCFTMYLWCLSSSFSQGWSPCSKNHAEEVSLGLGFNID